MRDILAHTYLGFGITEIPALIVLIAIIVVFIVKNHKVKKEIKDLEDQVQEQPETVSLGEVFSE